MLGEITGTGIFDFALWRQFPVAGIGRSPGSGSNLRHASAGGVPKVRGEAARHMGPGARRLASLRAKRGPLNGSNPAR